MRPIAHVALAALLTFWLPRPAVAIAQPACRGDHAALRVSAMPTLTDIFELNRELTAHGEPTVGHQLSAAGLDAVAQHGLLIGGATADWVLPATRSNPAATVRTDGILGETFLGLAPWCNAHWSAFALAGLGATSLQLSVARRAATSVSSVLAGVAAGGAMSNLTAFDDYGAGAEYRSGRWSVGARVGYVERFGNAHWSVSGRPIADGPKYGLSGPYVRLSAGLGY